MKKDGIFVEWYTMDWYTVHTDLQLIWLIK